MHYLVQPAAQEATGYGFEEVCGRLWREVFNWHPAQQEDERMLDRSANRRFEWNANGLTAID